MKRILGSERKKFLTNWRELQTNPQRAFGAANAARSITRSQVSANRFSRTVDWKQMGTFKRGCSHSGSDAGFSPDPGFRPSACTLGFIGLSLLATGRWTEFGEGVSVGS